MVTKLNICVKIYEKYRERRLKEDEKAI
jgi:hypothetical protein